jgi:FKBP-type peptidyl-prolyl cis-trans isomerase FklB
MKPKILVTFIVAGLLATSALATESSTSALPPAPDKGKLSYAVGLRLGLQMLHAGTNVDVNIAMHAVDDVLEGKPPMMTEVAAAAMLNHARTGEETEKDKDKFSYAGGMRAALLFKHTGMAVDPATVIQAMQDVAQGDPKMKQSEIGPLFMQAARYQAAQKKQANEVDGTAFLAQNAKKPGIKILPDGLQYEIIQPGTGPLAKPDDLIYVNYRGTFINGVEFDHHPHFLTRITGGIQGWKDVLPKMPVGSKWRIYVPSELAFGPHGESFHGVSPDSTVVYDLELISIAPTGGNYEISSGLGHGLDIGVPTDSKAAANSTQ